MVHVEQTGSVTPMQSLAECLCAQSLSQADCDPMDCSPLSLCPWDFPCMNTAVGCHSPPCIKVYVKINTDT